MAQTTGQVRQPKLRIKANCDHAPKGNLKGVSLGRMKSPKIMGPHKGKR